MDTADRGDFSEAGIADRGDGSEAPSAGRGVGAGSTGERQGPRTADPTLPPSSWREGEADAHRAGAPAPDG